MQPIMTPIIYGISNCDTVKKAKKWLDTNGVNYQYHDFRKDGLDSDTIASWLTEIDTEVLVNRRSTTWKQLSDEDKARAESDTAALLTQYPTLIKRPVLVTAKELLVGFKEARYQQRLDEDFQ